MGGWKTISAAVIALFAGCGKQESCTWEDLRTIKKEVAIITEKKLLKGDALLQSGQIKKINYLGEAYPDSFYVTLTCENINNAFGIDDKSLFEKSELGDKVELTLEERRQWKRGPQGGMYLERPIHYSMMSIKHN